MRFLVDEDVGLSVAEFLKAAGHDVVLVGVEFPGVRDREILERARAEGRILITLDKGFGELVFGQLEPSAGVIFLRSRLQRPEVYMDLVREVLRRAGDRLEGAFTVATETKIRVRRTR